MAKKDSTIEAMDSVAPESAVSDLQVMDEMDAQVRAILADPEKVRKLIARQVKEYANRTQRRRAKAIAEGRTPRVRQPKLPKVITLESVLAKQSTPRGAVLLWLVSAAEARMGAEPSQDSVTAVHELLTQYEDWALDILNQHADDETVNAAITRWAGERFPGVQIGVGKPRSRSKAAPDMEAALA